LGYDKIKIKIKSNQQDLKQKFLVFDLKPRS